MNRGVLLALAAYTLWGLLPLYWKRLDAIDSLEILANRIIWSFACFALYFGYRRNFRWLISVFRNPRQLIILVAISILITANWGIYIWAVNSNQVVETSLGYFINPLANVLLGVLLLGERLRKLQWISAGIATLGVLYLTFDYGRFPWIAISLAATFALYGLLKKKSTFTSMQGMLLETALVALPAALYLLHLSNTSQLDFLKTDAVTTWLVIASGFLTALPLLLFSSAAKQIPLSILGLLQYTAPSLQLLIGVFAFHEPFDHQRMIGFSIIWLSLLIFTTESILHRSSFLKRPTVI